MPKTKELSTDDLFTQLLEKSFDERVKFHADLTENIRLEAERLKEAGEKASNVLKTINGKDK